MGLLRTRGFGTFWVASFLSSIGTWAQTVAEPWLLLTLGASPFLIGLDSFATDAPVWLLTLVGGILADRADRRRVIAQFQSIQMLCPAAVVLLLVTGLIRPWMIIALSSIVGVTDALSMPSFQSIVPSLLPREEIGSGLALSSAQFNLSRILGPAIAGVLLSTAGAITCFIVSAASYVPFIGVAVWILPRWTPAPARADEASAGHLLGGIGAILRKGHLRGALLTVFATGVLCSPLLIFTPVLVRNVFHGGAMGFSAALVAFGTGGLLGSAGLLSTAASVDRRRVSAGFAIVYGLALVLVAVNVWQWALLPLLVVAGASMTISNTAANSLLQSTAPPHALGQTVSLYMLAIRGGSSIGALLTGVAIGRLGVQHALLFDGIAAVAVQAALARTWFRAPLPGAETNSSTARQLVNS